MVKFLGMRTNEIKVIVYEYEDLNELPVEYADLLKRAREAAKNAYAPYSEYYVGAAVRLVSGEIITGNNQENAAFPSGLCAERVALFSANANFPEKAVSTIAVTALNKDGHIHDSVSPCGACRQVLLETESKFHQHVNIVLDGAGSVRVLEGVENLLPISFRPESLK